MQLSDIGSRRGRRTHRAVRVLRACQDHDRECRDKRERNRAAATLQSTLCDKTTSLVRRFVLRAIERKMRRATSIKKVETGFVWVYF